MALVQLNQWFDGTAGLVGHITITNSNSQHFGKVVSNLHVLHSNFGSY